MSQGPAPIRDRVTARELVKYPRLVASRVTDLVNNGPYRVRLLDGGHLRIYAPDPQVPPFKVSASRPPEHTLRRLEPWVERTNH